MVGDRHGPFAAHESMSFVKERMVAPQRQAFFDDRAVRRAAMLHQVPCITTLTGAAAAVSAIRATREEGVGVRALQDYHAEIAADRV